MKNRTIIGIICIVLALVVTFAVAPLVNKIADYRTDIVRLTGDVVQGHMISDTDIEVVTVGSYNLPTDVITKKEDVLGKFAAVDLKLIELHVPVRSTAYFHCELDAGVEIPMDELHEVFSMMELYANRLAAVLLMPKSLVMRNLKKHHNGEPVKLYGTSIIAQDDKLAMMRMADSMGVSYTALFNRMRELDIFDRRDGDEYMEQLLGVKDNG